MLCKFKEISEGVFKCDYCGRTLGPFNNLSADKLFFECYKGDNMDNQALAIQMLTGKVTTLPTDLEQKIKEQIEVQMSTPNYGPGTELHLMLDKLGFRLDPKNLSCKCQAMIDKMNRWGIKGCRENKAEIAKHLNEQKHLTPMVEKINAGRLAWKEGLPWTINGLIEEAIARAEKKGASCNKQPPPSSSPPA